MIPIIIPQISANLEGASFEIAGIGTIIMVGEGPWRVASNGGASHEIKDSNGRVANPTIVQKFSTTGRKPNRNVVFAKLSDARRVVEKANELLLSSQVAE